MSMPTARTWPGCKPGSQLGTQGSRRFWKVCPNAICACIPPEDVLHHMEMADHLGEDSVQLDLKRGRHWYELTLVTNDRPFLFANVAGALAAWGMNIVKANAFSNQAGVVVDTFYFTDRFRTLELNLPEWERFKRSISDVLTGEADLDRMLHDRSALAAKQRHQSEGPDQGRIRR